MGRVEELRAFVDQFHPDLDLYSYYQLLELAPEASADDVRTAFYQQAARLHPDRFAALRDAPLRAKLVAIYARIAEAYRVLSDARKRAAYDAGLAQGRLRYLDVERGKKGPANPEDWVQKPEAKKFVRLALQAQRSGDAQGAAMNFKFALSYEPSNEWLQQQHAAAEAEHKKR